MLSGRFPNHVTGTQAPTCSNFLPLEFELIAGKLKQAHYSTHFIGKGHLGYQTTDHLPINRGFDTHVGYLGGAEGYSYGNGDKNPTEGKHDMWHDHGPGIDVVPEIFYSANFYTTTAVNVIQNHSQYWQGKKSTPNPLWVHLAYQNVHAPYVNPPAWECHAFPEMWDATFANMLHVLDDGINNVTNAIKVGNLWDNTLLIFSADNGGIGPANNHPLRGHKHDPWEGGTRVTSFVSGGFIPQALRGSRNTQSIVHIIDWYARCSGF
jgi:arylsulfatase I/J